MKKVKTITINKDGTHRYNLASTAANDDWLRSARLLKEGKIEELRELKSQPMYYRPASLLKQINKHRKK